MLWAFLCLVPHVPGLSRGFIKNNSFSLTSIFLLKSASNPNCKPSRIPHSSSDTFADLSAPVYISLFLHLLNDPIFPPTLASIEISYSKPPPLSLQLLHNSQFLSGPPISSLPFFFFSISSSCLPLFILHNLTFVIHFNM